MILKKETFINETETVIVEGKITGSVQLHFNQSLGAGKSDNMMDAAPKNMFPIWALSERH